MNSLGKFLLAKDRNAIVIAFLCALLQIFHFPTGFIAVIIVGLVTLQKGAKSGFWILTWVALPTISLLALRHVGLFDLLFLRCIVLWLLAILLRRYQSWGLLLEIVAFVGVICILLLHLRLPNLQQWWAQELSAYIKPVIAESHWHIKITPAEFAARLSPFATGLSAFFIAVTVLLEL
ncbi:MAG: hypothetical protein NTU49_06070, partial [Gammaproteobacteria bacterium]|nr:hypothetical protein [Gammaproteobacteria bacterium]